MSGFSSFRKTAWDPLLILSQIATVQCFGYSAFSFCMVAASLLTDIQLSPQLLFDSRRVRGDTVEGWVIDGGLLAIGLINIVPLVYLVERSRLCIDFSLTFYIIHLILVWWHQGGPPTTLLWWIVMAASGSAMAFIGRAACLRRELLPIAIRNFLPDHPREDGSDAAQGSIGVEEHELETRQPTSTSRRDTASANNADSSMLRRKEPEVLYDGGHLDDDGDDGDGDGDDDVHGASASNTKAGGAGATVGGGDETDGWDNDNWGEDDYDDIGDDDDGDAAAASKSKPPAKNKTNLPKGDKAL